MLSFSEPQFPSVDSLTLIVYCTLSLQMAPPDRWADTFYEVIKYGIRLDFPPPNPPVSASITSDNAINLHQDRGGFTTRHGADCVGSVVPALISLPAAADALHDVDAVNMEQ